MTKVMIPSEDTITSGQIGKIQEDLGAALRKSGLLREAVQQLIETQSAALNVELVAAIRKRVEAMSSIIVRRVKVDRIRTPQAMLTATGRKQYVTDSVVSAMPHGTGDEVEVFFFKPDLKARKGYISDADLDLEYELRGLKPADPYSQGAVNEDDPAFADGHPNGTHWKDTQDKWCYAAFYRWHDGERRVLVYRGGNDWSAYGWFAGLRK
ncbi:MAG: hypothetical protein WCI89_03545 [bacterium]